jgi:hypothetical protein
MEEKEVTEEIIPFKWKGWDEFGILMNFYFDVEFTEDFGAFKKDDVFESIMVDLQKGLIEAYDKDGKILKSQKMKCVPID